MDSLSAWREAALAKPANASALEEEEPLSSSDEHEMDMEEQKPAAPKKTSSSWVRWWRSSHTEQPTSSTSSNLTSSSSSKTITEQRSRPMLVPSVSEPPINSEKRTMKSKPLRQSTSLSADDISPNGKRYAKTLRLTSDQLVSPSTLYALDQILMFCHRETSTSSLARIVLPSHCPHLESLLVQPASLYGRVLTGS